MERMSGRHNPHLFVFRTEFISLDFPRESKQVLIKNSALHFYLLSNRLLLKEQKTLNSLIETINSCCRLKGVHLSEMTL